MNKEEFLNELLKIDLKVTSDILKRLDIYCQFLLEYNNHTNLTAIKEENQVYLKHFYDSLTITKIIDLTKYNTLVDIGTGAGFPGMVLKIFFPHLHVTLLDSNNKKIIFLQELSKKLDINDINFYHGRAEDFCQNNRGKYDIITARAVSNMSVLSELCLPLVKLNGYFIAMKGSNTEEIEEALPAINILGGNIEEKITFYLPIEKSLRNIIKIKKIKITPQKYPRRYDKIIKSPLKKSGK